MRRQSRISTKYKTANGFTLIEVLIAVALFVFFTVSLLQAFNIGFFSIQDIEVTNLAYYLGGRKMEQLRDTAYDSIVSEGRTPIPGFSGYESQVDTSFPQSPNQNIKKVTVTVHYSVKDGPKSLFITTLIVNG